MKNIHILPTDKPSKLLKQDNGKYILSKTSVFPHISKHLSNINQTIYITSDEEIKDGDWCYQTELPNLLEKCKNKEENWITNRGFKKIILTTDKDLIADGVQSIPDEFLEWFVKNPSCEFIRVGLEIWNDGNHNPIIIIPKEEAKQEKLHRLIK